MAKKILSVLLIFSIVLCFFPECACASESLTPTLPVLKNTSSNAIADGYDALGGIWAVGGLYYKKHLIDIADDDSLSDSYDTTLLFFYEDGTFLYMNALNCRGEYTPNGKGGFILKTESVFLYDITEDGLVEKEIGSSGTHPYLVTVLDENTIKLDDLDPATGNATVDSYTLVFVKEGQSSDYIQENKTPLNGSSNAKDRNNSSSLDKPSAPEKIAPQAPSSGTTSGMRNALKSAKDYLSVMPFSYSGLVEQLEYEGYSKSEAIYAADNCGADWYEQAVKSAKRYLEVMPFSRSGLIDQLEYEGYTHNQAVYGVNEAY